MTAALKAQIVAGARKRHIGASTYATILLEQSLQSAAGEPSDEEMSALIGVLNGEILRVTAAVEREHLHTREIIDQLDEREVSRQRQLEASNAYLRGETDTDRPT